MDGRIVDLQGNILAPVDAKYEMIYSFDGDYARVKMNGKYGLIDRAGREILPCEYDQITDDDGAYFVGGYHPVIKDGKFGYVNRSGEVTCDFVYAESAMNSIYRMPAAYLTDLSGNQIILSGAAGELPEKYAEVAVNTVNGCQLIAVGDGNDHAGLIDLYGNVVVALDGTYDDVYDLSLSKDGTLAVGYRGSRTYQVYNFAFDGAAAETAQPAAEEAAAETAETTETTEDGEWTCTCGSVNSGKFCPECGTAKPAGCPNCGATAAEGAKFCSECGTSLAAN